MLGMHGMGVSVPMAADVADATVGLDRERHIPKGGMFTIGFESLILAIGLFDRNTLFAGRTIREEDAVPKGHFRVAVDVTYESDISNRYYIIIYHRNGWHITKSMHPVPDHNFRNGNFRTGP